MKRITIGYILVVFLYFSHNANAQWIKAPLQNSGNVYCLTFIGNNLYAGTDNGLFLSTNYGATWNAISNGLTNKVIRAFTHIGNSLFVGTLDGIYISNDGGANWIAHNDGLSSKSIWCLIANNNILYAGTNIGGGVFRSTNNGLNWTDISTTETKFYQRGVSAMIEYKGSIIVGTFHDIETGGIYRLKDNEQSWEKLTTVKYVKSFAKTNDELFAGTWNSTGIISTTDNGVTWKTKNNGLNVSDVYGLYFINDNLYAGTHLGGSYLSTNNGTSWTSIKQNITNSTAICFAQVDSSLYVGTDGGIWRKDPNLKRNISLSSNPIDGGIVSGGGTFDFWSVIKINAVANSGYGFYNWTINNQNLSNSNEYEFAVSEHMSIVANFKKIYLVTLTNLPSDGGTTTGQGTKLDGSIITLTAFPNLGYNFINWTENGIVISTSPNLSLTISSNRNIQANYELKQYSILTNCEPLIGGTTTGSGKYTHGSIVTLQANPSPKYLLLNWTENNKVISTSNIYSFNAMGERNLTANFLTIPLAPIANTAGAIKQTSFNASWLKANSADGYILDVALDDKFITVLSNYNKRDVKNMLTFTVSGISPNSTFYYRVKSYNIAGESEEYSNIIKVQTLQNPPTTPTSKVATDVTLNSFTANWNSVSGADGYTFDLAIDDKFVNTLSAYKNKDVGNNTSLPINGLATNMNYYYRVKAYNNGGSSGYSNTIKVGLFVGIEKSTTLPNEFNLWQNFPNPFNPETKIQFEIPKESYVLLRVFDVLGNEVETLVNQILPPATYNVNFNASKLNNGVYFYRLDTDGFTQTRKMILLK